MQGGLRLLLVAVGVGLAPWAAVSQDAGRVPLVVISIDGMRPDYVTKADEHGLKIPALRAFLARGTYADGVVPTLTYPSHTTILTGVWPAEHGVYGNLMFDPLQEHSGRWYWDFSAIRVEMLYQAAKKAGIVTGAVDWPVTVGAPIDYDVAPYGTAGKFAYIPVDLLNRLGVAAPKDDEDDDAKVAASVAILRKYKPGLMLVHLLELDEEQHRHGPFSVEANARLEKIDAQVAAIERAALAVDARTRVVVVSDHGFARVERMVNLNVLLARAGLMRLGRRGKVVSWKAEAWATGGSAAIMLRDAGDAATLAAVKKVIAEAATDPAYGIVGVLTGEQAEAMGGLPGAALVVDFRDGFDAGVGFSGAVVEDVAGTGMHGYLPTHEAMRAAFMVMGEGVAVGRDLGVVDMRAVAPALAEMLGLKLEAAKVGAVGWRR